MPSLRDPLLDERYDELAARIRASRPSAPAELRDRVSAIARSEAPAPRPRFARLRGRGVRLAPALVLVGLLAAVAVGVVALRDTGGGVGGGDQSASSGGEAASLEAQEDAAAPVTEAPPGAGRDAVAPEPSPGRLQDYRVELTLRVADVDELARATDRAMEVARTLGGHVVTATFDAPAGAEGDSRLVLRVPLARVQDAIGRLAALGTIASQRIDLQDLQGTVDQQADAIAQARATVARLEAELRRDDLTDAERALLRSELSAARAELARLEEAREATVEQGRFAQVSLTLTTRAPAAAPEPRGEAEETLRDALSALGTIGVWLLAALVVAGPLAALALVVFLAVRRVRRRADERLLDRA